MEITLNYPKKEFEKELRQYISEGELIINKKVTLLITSELEKIEKDFNLWAEEVSEFLKIRLDSIGTNEYLKNFKFTETSQSFKRIAKVIAGENISSLQAIYQSLIENCKEKIKVLLILERKLKFIEVNEFYFEPLEIENTEMKMEYLVNL